jgi:hypothetical protein
VVIKVRIFVGGLIELETRMSTYCIVLFKKPDNGFVKKLSTRRVRGAPTMGSAYRASLSTVELVGVIKKTVSLSRQLNFSRPRASSLLG